MQLLRCRFFSSMWFSRRSEAEGCQICLFRSLFCLVLLLMADLTALAADHPVNVNCNADLLCVEVFKAAQIRLIVDNRTIKPLSFGLFLQGYPDSAKPFLLTLDQPQRVELVALPNDGRRWSYEYRIHYGHERYPHDDGYLYRLPYAPDSAFEVTQSHTNLTTHHTGNRFALDFAMPIGTPVHAARGGRVVSVFQDSDARSLQGEASANHVWILHSDGTIGKYLHLAHQGVRVSEQDLVDAGEMIGVSGNTGFSTGEHLHFSVSTLHDGTLYETFNLRFATGSGEEHLVSGMRYLNPSAVRQPKTLP
ncbi:MAG: M23 family metallopeptidase [Pseudomonadales bacterium]